MCQKLDNGQAYYGHYGFTYNLACDYPFLNYFASFVEFSHVGTT